MTLRWLLPIAILLYSSWNARELVNAWIYAPLDSFGWLPFLIWLVPVGVNGKKPETSVFLWMALILTLLGNLGSLNALKYLGFSSAIAALLPFSWATVIWWACSIGWMPAFGWFGSHYFPDSLFISRCIITGISSLLLIFIMKRKIDV